jgi:hypothetical protein
MHGLAKKSLSADAERIDEGIPIGIRVVTQGMPYGRGGVLTREEEDPLIEFYDLRHLPEPDMLYTGVMGLFVSRFKLHAIEQMHCGLVLGDTDEALWLSPKNLAYAVKIIKSFLRETRLNNECKSAQMNLFVESAPHTHATHCNSMWSTLLNGAVGAF